MTTEPKLADLTYIRRQVTLSGPTSSIAKIFREYTDILNAGEDAELLVHQDGTYSIRRLKPIDVAQEHNLIVDDIMFHVTKYLEGGMGRIDTSKRLADVLADAVRFGVEVYLQKK